MFYSVNCSVLNMRESPSSESKVVSQALFGEEVKIVGESGPWRSIQTPDGYVGWVLASSLAAQEEPYLGAGKIRSVSRLAAPLYSIPDVEYGPLLTLPFGCKIRILEEVDSRWMRILLPAGEQAFIQKGDIEPEKKIEGREGMIAFSQRFLGIPYIWGGRSSFGYDCSGFVQMVYEHLGVKLPRDARQQIFDPRLVPILLDDLKTGDFVFYGKSGERILHVGIYLEEEKFIHASTRENKPYVRISRLSDPEWNGCPDSYYPYRTFRRLNS